MASARALRRAWHRVAAATLGGPAGGPKSAGAAPEGTRFRVLQLNTLADCLARAGAGPLDAKRGFRCEATACDWGHRSRLLEQELTRHECDIIGLCEVDRYDDFYRPVLTQHGFDGLFKRKRTPAKDGVAIFWRRSRWEEGLHRFVYLEQPGARKTPGAQVALMQRLRARPTPRGGPGLASGSRPSALGGGSLVVCATHFRASASDSFRMQQASEVVKALKDFSRDEPQIILADLNSQAPADAEACGRIDSVLGYFAACGFRCAYRLASSGRPLPAYTTWAGWGSGDFQAVCDHILVSEGLAVEGVLDVPEPEGLALAFPERLPNHAYPSDHMALVADLVLT